MPYELPTLPTRNTRQGNCQAPSVERGIEEQKKNNARAAGKDAGIKKCKDCQAEIKSGSRCGKCRYRLNPKQSTGRPWGTPCAIDNFKFDANGNRVEKICTTCKEWKPMESFSKRTDTPSGVRPFCKDCEKERGRICAQKHRQKHYQPKQKIEKSETCNHCSKTFQTATRAKYCGEDCRLAFAKKRTDDISRENNSIRFATHQTCFECKVEKPLSKYKLPSCGFFKIMPTRCEECRREKGRVSSRKSKRLAKNKPRLRLSKRFREVMNSTKRGGTPYLKDFIGCSTAFLRKHLESQFTKGMRWNNYGTMWQVDHILPVASFDHNDDDQARKCWHYSNLRPLCAIENGRKSDSIITCQPELLLSM